MRIKGLGGEFGEQVSRRKLELEPGEELTLVLKRRDGQEERIMSFNVPCLIDMVWHYEAQRDADVKWFGEHETGTVKGGELDANRRKTGI